MAIAAVRSKPKSSPVGGLSFDDAIGEQSEAIPGGEANGVLGVIGFEKTKGQAGGAIDFLAVAIRGEMARVGEGEDAGGGEMGAEAGDEAAVAAVDEHAVETGEELGGAEDFAGQGPDGADGQGALHGGFEAFSTDIADDDESRAIWQGDDLVEVAAHLRRRNVGCLQREALQNREFDGHESLLHFAGGGQLEGEAIAVTPATQGLGYQRAGGDEADVGYGEGKGNIEPAGQAVCGIAPSKDDGDDHHAERDEPIPLAASQGEEAGAHDEQVPGHAESPLHDVGCRQPGARLSGGQNEKRQDKVKGPEGMAGEPEPSAGQVVDFARKLNHHHHGGAAGNRKHEFASNV